MALVPAAGVVTGLLLGARGHVPRETAAVLLVAWAVAALAYVRARPLWLIAAVWVGVAASAALLLDNAVRDVLDAPVRRILGPVADRPRRLADQVVVSGRLVDDGTPTTFGASLSLEVTRIGEADPAPGGLGTVRLSVSGGGAAAAVPAWRAGRLVRCPLTPRRPLPFRNPGVTDQGVALARRGTALLGSVKSAALVEVCAPGAAWQEAAGAARAWVRRTVEQAVGRWSRESAGVVTAILIGDRAGLSPETEGRLQRAGTYHVIAISGGNVAVLAMLSLAAFRVAGAGPRVGALGSAVLLLAYYAVVATGSSVARATVMGVGWLLARGLGSRAEPVNLLFFSTVLLVAARPLHAYDAGFALSAGATLGILVGVGRLVSVLDRPACSCPARARALVRAVAGLAAATACAEAVVLPITAFAFSQVTFAGLLLNFVAVPAMAVIQVAGLAAVGLTTSSSALAAGAGWVAHEGVEALVRSARLADAWPWCAGRVPPPPAGLIAFYYATLLAALLHTRWRSVRLVSAGAAGLAIMAMVAGPTVRAWWAAPGGRGRAATLTVTFLDVGQGDSALLQFPGGGSLLVDAGGQPGAGFDVGARVVAPALWAMGTVRLSGAAITHGHPDHAGGMEAVLDAFRPPWTWEGVAVSGDALTTRLRDVGRRLGVGWRHAYGGTAVEIDGVSLRVLHPRAPSWERPRVFNDDSVVIEARYRDASFVLMGDAGEKVEADLGEAVGPARLRVLKAGHHGSADATSTAWLDRLRPDAVVVSAGRNNVFNHPSPVMLERCRATGRPVFRLDQLGAVRASTDGRRLVIASWSGPGWEQLLEVSRAP